MEATSTPTQPTAAPEQPPQPPRRPSQARAEQPPEEHPGSTRETELLRRAAEEKIQDTEIHDALEVFLAAEGETAWEPKELKINVGSEDEPRFVKWVIGPIEDTEINKIREQSPKKGANRAQRRAGMQGDVDESLVARRIVARATITPDMTGLARQLHMADPSDAVYAYFRKFGKTGLISMISERSSPSPAGTTRACRRSSRRQPGADKGGRGGVPPSAGLETWRTRSLLPLPRPRAGCRPFGEPDAAPRSPSSIRRYKAFIYGCAVWAEEQDIEKVKAQAGASSSRRQGVGQGRR